jgi:hypothetical protein
MRVLDVYRQQLYGTVRCYTAGGPDNYKFGNCLKQDVAFEFLAHKVCRSNERVEG